MMELETILKRSDWSGFYVSVSPSLFYVEEVDESKFHRLVSEYKIMCSYLSDRCLSGVSCNFADYTDLFNKQSEIFKLVKVRLENVKKILHNDNVRTGYIRYTNLFYRDMSKLLPNMDDNVLFVPEYVTTNNVDRLYAYDDFMGSKQDYIRVLVTRLQEGAISRDKFIWALGLGRLHLYLCNGVDDKSSSIVVLNGYRSFEATVYNVDLFGETNETGVEE